MALLQCCFEGVEYVELLNTGEEDVKELEQPELADRTHSLSRIRCRERPRPPRRLREILCAAATTVVSATVWACIFQQAWAGLLRSGTEDWCNDSKGGNANAALGWIEANSKGAFCGYFRCAVEVEVSVALCGAALGGPLALRAYAGSAYFRTWSDVEELHELERLYRERGNGEAFVLHVWRGVSIAAFLFEIVVWMWLRYYLDLYLDVQAMRIFWETGDFTFWWSNLGGIVLGLFWTAVEFFRILRNERGAQGLPAWQILVVGLLIPLAGLHVTYLSVLSLASGTRHRFLFISTLAESILEAAVSAFVQTYAVVLSQLSVADKFDLYTSIALSFVSIGYAFSSLDKFEGGELLAQLPGVCRTSSSQYWVVFVFRIAEVTSRATSLALFHVVWRPWGTVWVISADTAVILLCVSIYQTYRGWAFRGSGFELFRNNAIYALPSCICLMSPLLEKDSPLAVPPEFYYGLRLLELVGMALLVGWQLNWDFTRAATEFADDFLAVMLFFVSTLLMFGLAFVVRRGLAQRVLLEAPAEMWQMRPLSVTQLVMRDRILSWGKGSCGEAWEREHSIIVARIKSAPQRSSRQLFTELAPTMSERMRKRQWEARFLAAKISCTLEQALDALDKATQTPDFMATACDDRQRRRRAVPRSSSILDADVHRQGSGGPRTCRVSTSGCRIGRGRGRGALRFGSLAQLSSPQGVVAVSAGGHMQLRWAEDVVDQKLVIDAVEEGGLDEVVYSGAPVLLRATREGRFLGAEAATQPSKDVGADDPEALMQSCSSPTPYRNVIVAPEPPEERKNAAEFGLFLIHEEEYRNAEFFQRHVELKPGSLEVYDLNPITGSKPQTWSPTGWCVGSVNGMNATRCMLDSILATAKAEAAAAELARAAEAAELACAACGSAASNAPASGTSPIPPHASTPTDRPCPLRLSMPLEGVTKFVIRYEKAHGNDMPLNFGDKVVIRLLGRPSEDVGLGLPVGLLEKEGRGARYQTKTPGAGAAGILSEAGALAASHNTAGAAGLAFTELAVGDALPPATFVIEAAEVGGRDDSPVYAWAAAEIRRRALADVERSSLAEKCRVALTVSFNARSDISRGFGPLSSPGLQKLHLRALLLLSRVLRPRREVELAFDKLRDVFTVLRFRGDDDNDETFGDSTAAAPGTLMSATASGRLLVEEVLPPRAAWGNETDLDVIARRAEAGDEVLEVEVDRNGPRNELRRASSGVRELLLLCAPRAQGHSAATPRLGECDCLDLPVAILIRSSVRTSLDTNVEQILLGQAEIIAQLLPAWGEILVARDLESDPRGMSAKLLRHNELFRLKCFLVTNLLQRGWELKYESFAEAACMLHRRFGALTLQTLRAWISCEDTAAETLCEMLLAVQLDVLTAAWAAAPKAVKEHRPEVLRQLFRHNAELPAMRDAVDLLYRSWRERERDSKGIVEIPDELRRFFERVRPAYTGESGSAVWFVRAWSEAEHETESEAVQGIVEKFTEIFEGTEQYWEQKLGAAASNMERAQENVDSAVEAADTIEAQVPAALVKSELPRIINLIDPEKLSLREELRICEAVVVPAGLELVRRGNMFEMIDERLENDHVHAQLKEFVPVEGKDVQLFFGGKKYHDAKVEFNDAMNDLGIILRAVRRLEAAFPESLAEQCRALVDQLHRNELRAVTHENKRQIRIKEKEAQEISRTAKMRVASAEAQRKDVEARLGQIEGDLRETEVARQEAQRRADQAEKRSEEMEILHQERIANVQAVMQQEHADMVQELERKQQEKVAADEERLRQTEAEFRRAEAACCEAQLRADRLARRLEELELLHHQDELAAGPAVTEQLEGASSEAPGERTATKRLNNELFVSSSVVVSLDENQATPSLPASSPSGIPEPPPQAETTSLLDSFRPLLAGIWPQAPSPNFAQTAETSPQPPVPQEHITSTDLLGLESQESVSSEAVGERVRRNSSERFQGSKEHSSPVPFFVDEPPPSSSSLLASAQSGSPAPPSVQTISRWDQLRRHFQNLGQNSQGRAPAPPLPAEERFARSPPQPQMPNIGGDDGHESGFDDGLEDDDLGNAIDVDIPDEPTVQISPSRRLTECKALLSADLFASTNSAEIVRPTAGAKQDDCAGEDATPTATRSDMGSEAERQPDGVASERAGEDAMPTAALSHKGSEGVRPNGGASECAGDDTMPTAALSDVGSEEEGQTDGVAQSAETSPGVSGNTPGLAPGQATVASSSMSPNLPSPRNLAEVVVDGACSSDAQPAPGQHEDSADELLPNPSTLQDQQRAEQQEQEHVEEECPILHPVSEESFAEARQVEEGDAPERTEDGERKRTVHNLDWLVDSDWREVHEARDIRKDSEESNEKAEEAKSDTEKEKEDEHLKHPIKEVAIIQGTADVQLVKDEEEASQASEQLWIQRDSGLLEEGARSQDHKPQEFCSSSVQQSLEVFNDEPKGEAEPADVDADPTIVDERLETQIEFVQPEAEQNIDHEGGVEEQEHTAGLI